MTYKEPPMRFDPGLKKYAPDMPQKPGKGKPYEKNDAIKAFVVALIVVILLLLAFSLAR